ncbi:hypothetical protein CPB97_004526 [Podila verticillata]|nr:hypothetical protein CPB97_004526 [Podila verticillata]
MMSMAECDESDLVMAVVMAIKHHGHISTTTIDNQTYNISIMPFFKSSKNQSASAAASPAQTPRTSMQEQRPAAHKMTQQEALEYLMSKTMGDAAASSYIR